LAQIALDDAKFSKINLDQQAPLTVGIQILNLKPCNN